MSFEKRVQKTIDYLNSAQGKENWEINLTRGYTYSMNLFAAVQTATLLIKYETITEIINEIRGRWSKEIAA